MPNKTRSPQEQIDPRVLILSTQPAPHIELSDEAIARITGGLHLQSTQTMQRLHDHDVPDCLIWDIDTPSWEFAYKSTVHKC